MQVYHIVIGMKTDHYNKGRQAFSHTVGKVRQETTKQNTNKKGDQKHGKNHKQNKRVQQIRGI